MSTKRITYENKKYLRNDPDYPKEQTITDEDMNEIKDVVNLNASEQDIIIEKLKNAVLNAETEEAKSLYVEDANKFGELEVKGNAEQETSTASANILDTYLFEEKTINGITLTKKENGAIVLNGTATAQTIFEANLKQSINKNGYTFKISKVSGTVGSNNVQFFLYSDGYTVNKNVAITTNVNSANKTLDNNTYTIERIVIPNGTVLSNVEINVMVSETDTSYVSFTPDAPSINYPRTVKCLGSNKNLLHMEEIETTKIGVIVKQQENILILNGTTNAAGNLLSGNYVDIGALKKGKYIFKPYVTGEYSLPSNSQVAFYIREKNNTSNIFATLSVKDLKEEKEVEINLEEEIDLTIQMFANASDIVFDNFEVKLKIEEGEVATSYSPYGQGSTEISKINKNLFDINNLEVGGFNTSNGQTISGVTAQLRNIDYIRVRPLTTYTFKAEGINNIVYLEYDKNKQYIGFKGWFNSNQHTFTTLENTKYIKMLLRDTSLISITVQNLKTPQLEKSNISTDYAEHQQTVYTLPIQQEMLTEDYFVKEADGWKEVHNKPELTLDGSDDENWAVNSYFSNVFSCNSPTDINGYETDLICNITNNFVTSGEALDSSTDGVAVGTTKINFKMANINTLEELKQYLSATNIKLYYKSTQETKLSCTEEQSTVLEELNNLELFEGVNNIITTEDIALLKLKYALDIKSYINNIISSSTTQTNEEII